MPEQVLSLHAEVKGLAKRFAIPYDARNPRDALERVCELALTSYTDDEWRALDYLTARRLTALGYAIEKGTLHVSAKECLPKPQEVRVEVLRLANQGKNFNEICECLHDFPHPWNKTTVKNYVESYRRKHMKPREKGESMRFIIISIMNGGRGIIAYKGVVKEIERIKATRERVVPECSPMYIKCVVYTERGRLGLGVKARTALKERRLAEKLENE